MKDPKPEQYGKTIFKVLKKKDVDGFMHTFPDREEFARFAKKYMVDQEDLEELLEEMDEGEWEEMLGRMRKDFEEILEEGEAHGIVWKDIQYEKFVYETYEERILSIDGYKGHIIFTHDTMTYSVKAKEVVPFKSGLAGRISGIYRYNLNTGAYSGLNEMTEEEIKGMEPEEIAPPADE